jgi:hypothetical protein
MKVKRAQKQWLVGLAAAMLIFIGSASKLQSADSAPADNQVFFYEDTNYGGNTMSFEYDTLVPDLTKWKVLNSKNTWNDRISSVKVGKNAKLILFADINYKGATITLLGTGSHGVGNFSTMPSGWNDKVSSMKIVMGDIN